MEREKQQRSPSGREMDAAARGQCFNPHATREPQILDIFRSLDHENPINQRGKNPFTSTIKPQPAMMGHTETLLHFKGSQARKVEHHWL